MFYNSIRLQLRLQHQQCTQLTHTRCLDGTGYGLMRIQMEQRHQNMSQAISLYAENFTILHAKKNLSFVKFYLHVFVESQINGWIFAFCGFVRLFVLDAQSRLGSVTQTNKHVRARDREQYMLPLAHPISALVPTSPFFSCHALARPVRSSLSSSAAAPMISDSQNEASRARERARKRASEV